LLDLGNAVIGIPSGYCVVVFICSFYVLASGPSSSAALEVLTA
jgi:hypothetical protein